MANWPTSPDWIDPSTINLGNEYTVSDGVTYEDFNKIVNNIIYLKNKGVSIPQEKTVSVTTNGTQIVEPDEGYSLLKVTLNVNVPAKTEEKTITIIENGTTTLTPSSEKDGLSKVVIHTDVPTGTDTSDATAVAADILKDKTAYVATGKVTGTIETWAGEFEEIGGGAVISGILYSSFSTGGFYIKTNGEASPTNYDEGRNNVHFNESQAGNQYEMSCNLGDFFTVYASGYEFGIQMSPASATVEKLSNRLVKVQPLEDNFNVGLYVID